MQKILNFLSSPKLAIVLFLILAFISIFGTVIPQNYPSQFYLMKYGSFWGKLILFFDLNDAYYSWWYVATLFLFMTNLIVCSIRKFPIHWKLYKKDPTQIEVKNFPYKYSLSLNAEPEKISQIISTKLNFKKANKESQEGILFYKDLNRWSFLSVYIVHASMLVIIIGALIGALTGFKGTMRILEGETSNMVIPYKSEKQEPIFLDFSIKLNKFLIEYYPDGTPKEYISKVTIIDKNKNKNLNSIIKVNSPFKYKGYSFYQASYETFPEFTIKIDYNGQNKTYSLSSFSPVIIDNRYTINLMEAGRAHGFLYAKILFSDVKTNKQASGIIIKGFPHFRIPTDKGLLQITLEGIKKINYISIFGVKKDPGTPLVYIGFVIMSLGLLAVYFFEPKTFWIFINPTKNGKINLTIGAYAKRERITLKDKIKNIAKEIEKNLSSAKFG